ncbi:hypothetical protein [Methylorubrum populi]|uniref:hypothetical protein n=1 Tax=Methylorubrum populi TaxID=223967 RepID=UPI003F65A588
MRRTLTALAALSAVAPVTAMAQAITNVNDCTFITDPIAVRRCIDGFQLRGPAAQYPQSAPIPPIETPAQAERNQLDSRTPPNASYKDSPGWLGESGTPPNPPAKASPAKGNAAKSSAHENPAAKTNVIDLDQ